MGNANTPFQPSEEAALVQTASTTYVERRLHDLVVGVGAPYKHTQASPAITWTVTHSKGRNPAGVLSTYTGGGEMKGGITFVDINTLTISFKTAQTGFAYVF